MLRGTLTLWLLLCTNEALSVLVSRQREYTVAVLVTAGEELAREQWAPTFENFLNETAGIMFEPPISFKMIPITLQNHFTLAQQARVDFVFSIPTALSCLQWEFGLVPLVTETYLYEGLELTEFGSVIFTRADNDAINSIADIRGSIVMASSISDAAGCQLPWGELQHHGISLLQDPAQVIFVGLDYGKIFQGVVDGVADVGLVSTSYMAGLHLHDHDGDVNQSQVKYLSTRREKLSGGSLFPFDSSTQLSPEWSLGALRHVDLVVREEVYKALVQLDRAHPAARAGRYAGWHSAASLHKVSSLQLRIGEMALLEEGKLRCPRPSDLYQALACPANHVKLSRAEVATGCTAAGLECGAGFECVCQPCQRSDDIVVVPLNMSDSQLAAGGPKIPAAGPPCRAVGVCAEMEQLEVLRLVVTDYSYRPDTNVTFLWHSEPGATEADDALLEPALPLPGWPVWQRVISVTTHKVGNHLLEVYVDGDSAPASPFFVNVVPRTCGLNQVANALGKCACLASTAAVNGRCVPLSVFLPAVIVPITLLLLAIVAFLARQRVQQAAASSLLIDPAELHFDEPPEILGRGSFGLVVKALFRGTPVAVKRVIPPSPDLAPPTQAFDGPWGGHTSVLSALQPEHAGTATPAPGSPARTQLLDEITVIEDDAPPADAPPADASLPSSPVLGRRGHVSQRRRSLADTGGLPAFTLSADGPSRQEEPPGSVASRPASKSSNPAGSGGRGAAGGIAGSSVGSMEMFGRRSRGPLAKHKEFILELHRRFVEEMEALARLRHPSIVTVMGAVVSEGVEPLLVMELMDHGSLHQLVHNSTVVTDDEMVLPILKDVINGMRFLHASDPPTVHGDLKPQNVLVDANMRAKVADFGLTQKKEVVENALGMAYGSPLWAPPERLRGALPTKAGDVYAFGILVCEVVTRKEPYFNMEVDSVIEAVTNPEPGKPPLRPEHEGVDEQLRVLMESCWSEDPLQRYSFAELEPKFKEIESVSLGGVYQSRPNANRMLEELFPAHVAQALVEGRTVQPEHKDCVSIFFSDIVGFTKISTTLSPIQVSEMLGRLYTKFDQISTKHEVFKVETIGDAYMAVTNLVQDQRDSHARRLLAFASEAVRAASQTLVSEEDPSMGSVQIRVGIHSGPVVANVVGTRNPRYCLFGDTVNTASRMESNSLPGCINVSKATARLLQAQYPDGRLEPRGVVDMKGKGRMECYLAEVAEHAHANPESLLTMAGLEAAAPVPQRNFSAAAVEAELTVTGTRAAGQLEPPAPLDPRTRSATQGWKAEAVAGALQVSSFRPRKHPPPHWQDQHHDRSLARPGRDSDRDRDHTWHAAASVLTRTASESHGLERSSEHEREPLHGDSDAAAGDVMFLRRLTSV